MNIDFRVGGGRNLGKQELGGMVRDLEADIHHEVQRRLNEADEAQGRDFAGLDQKLVRAAILSVVSRLKPD